MTVPKDKAIDYALYTLENIGKVIDRINFLKTIFEERDIGVNEDLLWMIKLEGNYNQIKNTYSNDQKFSQYLKALKKSLLNNEDQEFKGFPGVFSSFYLQIKGLLNFRFSKNLITQKALQKMLISQNLKPLIKKYIQPVFEGFLDMEIPIKNILSLAQFDSKHLVCGGYDFNVYIVNLQNGQIVNILKGHNGLISSILIDHNQIISGSFDKSVKIWDFQSGECLKTININQRIDSISLFQESMIIVQTFKDLMIYDQNGHDKFNLLGDIVVIKTFVYKNKILVIYRNAKIILWDPFTDQKVTKDYPDIYRVTDGIILNYKLIITSDVGRIYILNIKTLELEKELYNNLNVSGTTAINNIIALDDTTIVTSKNQGLEIWDITKNQPQIINIEIKNYHLLVDLMTQDIISHSSQGINILDFKGNKRFSLYSQGYPKIIVLFDGRLAVADNETIRIWK